MRHEDRSDYLSPEGWALMQRAAGNNIIAKVKARDGKRPACEARVKMAVGTTRTKLDRVARAKREGRDPNVCGRPAMWRIQNRCFCQSHAGQQAIDMLVMITNGGNL